jgi:hypothetical protein
MFHFGYPMNEDRNGYWGARAIFRGYGDGFLIDLLSDRQSHENISDDFLSWINVTALPWLRNEVIEQELSSSESKEISLEDGNFELKANTNGSHGYLYIGAIEKEVA